MAEGAKNGGAPPDRKKTRGDFYFSSVLGEGSYSTVMLAQEKSTKREFAIKVIRKYHIIKERKTKQVMREKECLKKLNHPFFIKLFFTFQDEENLYFGLSVARKGELLDRILAAKKFDFVCTRFYAAELIEAMEYMHSINIIHRDLKPENVLLDNNFHIQVTDFGSAKVLDGEDISVTRSSSFVGTAQYVSPELLKDKQAGKGSDLWALGCIIYQMNCGKPPFQAQNEYLTFQQIIKCQYEFPDEFHEDVKDVVQRLLVSDPQCRIGNGESGYMDLKTHLMFEGVEWETITTQPAPRFISSLDKTLNGSPPSNKVTTCRWDLDDVLISNATGLESDEKNHVETVTPYDPADTEGTGLPIEMSDFEKQNWMRKQEDSEWNSFTKGRLILKRGMMEKKRGFSVKLRQFLLMEGPRLIYIDPATLQQKGEIPWTSKLSVEAKTFRNFYVHTPNRTYHLIDKTNNAMKWVKKIEEVSRHYFGNHVKDGL